MHVDHTSIDRTSADHPSRSRRTLGLVVALGVLLSTLGVSSLLSSPASAFELITPDAPEPVVLTGNGSAEISWAVPDNNGVAIEGYRVQIYTTATTYHLPPGQLSLELPFANGVDERVRVGTKWGGGAVVWSDMTAPFTPTACGAPGPGPFVDVANNSVFCQPIEWMRAMGISNGYLDGTFRPADVVTRGAFAQLFGAAHGFASIGIPDEPYFTDVGPSHPFFLGIQWAAMAGVISGYPDGTFRPADPVTRQAAVAMVQNVRPGPHVVVLDQTFSDVPTDHPFWAPIEWTAAAGVVSGYPDGTFRPTDVVSRQAAAKILYQERLLHN